MYISKRNHEVGLIDDKGKHIGKTVRFANSKAGSEKLLKSINQYKLTPDNSVVGLEATGHYWLSVFSFLHKLGFKTTVFNPLQSDALRHFYIRKTKTDVSDAYLIAQVIRIDTPDESPFIEIGSTRIKTSRTFTFLIRRSKFRFKTKNNFITGSSFPRI